MNDGVLTVYYDGSCRYCTAESDAVRAVAPADALKFVDCSPPGFADADTKTAGITHAAMMEAIHVRDGSGRWFKGVEGFAQLYQYAGLPKIARLWAHPLIKPLATRVYPWVVRNRYFLSKLGLPALSTALIRFEARRANRRGQHCHDGNCSIEREEER